MKSIFDQSNFTEMQARIEKIQPDANRLVGKMDVAQMLAHCTEAMRIAVGDLKLKRSFMGYLIGGMVKKSYLSDKPFAKNSPTTPAVIITDTREFEKEKQILLALTKRMHQAGEAGATKNPHAFFGQMTPKEWGETQWKHLDHHLKQFGA